MVKRDSEYSETKYDQWEQTISSERPLIALNLSEIWRYRDLIALFVRRDFVSQYKQTILGPLWLFIQPLFTTLTFYVVFSKIASISTNNIDPLLFYLSGVTLWNYFSDCFLKTSNTFTLNAGIFGKVYFPRLALPISVILSNLIKFGIQFLLFLLVLVFQIVFQDKEVQANMTLLLLPLLLLIMAILGLGMGIIFSSLTTKYRDLSFLLAFGIQLFMYATPVIYPLSYTEGKLHTLLEFNPLTSILENFRYSFFSTGQFDWSGLSYSAGFSLVTLFFGVVIFNRVEKNFMDTV
jgi:lipopolysaccharide transport system permease protein